MQFVILLIFPAGFFLRHLLLSGGALKLDDFEKYRENVNMTVNDENVDVRCAMSAALILRHLERIAHHSSYIGDSVVYIVTGEHSLRK
jgi:hypothetical protein